MPPGRGPVADPANPPCANSAPPNIPAAHERISKTSLLDAIIQPRNPRFRLMVPSDRLPHAPPMPRSPPRPSARAARPPAPPARRASMPDAGLPSASPPKRPKPVSRHASPPRKKPRGGSGAEADDDMSPISAGDGDPARSPSGGGKPAVARAALSPSSATTPPSPPYALLDPRAPAGDASRYKASCARKRRLHFYPVNFNQAGVLLRRSSDSVVPVVRREKSELFVENLNHNITETFLRQKLASHGHVVTVSIPCYPNGHRAGIALVIFSPAVDGIAGRLHDTSIAGDRIIVADDPKAALFDAASRKVANGTYADPAERARRGEQDAKAASAREANNNHVAEVARECSVASPRGYSPLGNANLPATDSPYVRPASPFLAAASTSTNQAITNRPASTKTCPNQAGNIRPATPGSYSHQAGTVHPTTPSSYSQRASSVIPSTASAYPQTATASRPPTAPRDPRGARAPTPVRKARASTSTLGTSVSVGPAAHASSSYQQQRRYSDQGAKPNTYSRTGYNSHYGYNNNTPRRQGYYVPPQAASGPTSSGPVHSHRYIPSQAYSVPPKRTDREFAIEAQKRNDITSRDPRGRAYASHSNDVCEHARDPRDRSAAQSPHANQSPAPHATDYVQFLGKRRLSVEDSRSPSVMYEVEKEFPAIKFVAIPAHITEDILQKYVCTFGECDHVLRNGPFWVAIFSQKKDRDGALNGIVNDRGGFGGRRAKAINVFESDVEEWKRDRSVTPPTPGSGTASTVATPLREEETEEEPVEEEEEVEPTHKASYLDMYFQNDASALLQRVQPRPMKTKASLKKIVESDDESDKEAEQDVVMTPESDEVRKEEPEAAQEEPAKERRRRRKSRFSARVDVAKPEPQPILDQVAMETNVEPDNIIFDVMRDSMALVDVDVTLVKAKKPMVEMEEIEAKSDVKADHALFDAEVDFDAAKVEAEHGPAEEEKAVTEETLAGQVKKEDEMEVEAPVKRKKSAKTKKRASVGRRITRAEQKLFEQDCALAQALSVADMVEPRVANTRSRARRAKQEQTVDPGSAALDAELLLIKEEKKKAAEEAKKVAAISKQKPPVKPAKSVKRRPGRPRKSQTPDKLTVSAAANPRSKQAKVEPAPVEVDDGQSARTRLLDFRRRDKSDRNRFLPSFPEARATAANCSVTSAREERRNTRIYRKGVNALTTRVGGILSINALKSRGKKTTVWHSQIHGRGLFAGEKIEANQFVIEYIGEEVRPLIADLREETYTKMGIGDSYLFRLDKDTILDATGNGSKARFINHSCNPNVFAKVIKVGQEKKIVFYSQRVIQPDDEITYDYKFNIEAEEDKIPCFCKSHNCRKNLN